MMDLKPLKSNYVPTPTSICTTLPALQTKIMAHHYDDRPQLISTPTTAQPSHPGGNACILFPLQVDAPEHPPQLSQAFIIYQSRSPPRTTSVLEAYSSISPGSTHEVKGNSMGAVLTIRTTFPLPGVSTSMKKGRSKPSSV